MAHNKHISMVYMWNLITLFVGRLVMPKREKLLMSSVFAIIVHNNHNISVLY